MSFDISKGTMETNGKLENCNYTLPFKVNKMALEK
jgi:hypothetical protein